MKASPHRPIAMGCGLMLAAGLLVGCGVMSAPADLPDDLCELVGTELIVQVVPDAKVEPPYAVRTSQQNEAYCDASSAGTSPAELQVVLERHGSCFKGRREGTTNCNPPATNAKRRFARECDERRLDPDTWGREAPVPELGDRVCSTAAEADGEVTANLMMLEESDVVKVTYATRRPREAAADAARAVAQKVLTGLD
jgi:hypothetical protein